MATRSVLLYLASFSLFIFGLMRGTHPRTAKQGNLIAAVGMAIAVVTTLLLDGTGNWGVIIGGLAVGTAVGYVASVRVQMTEMPQMVALYNGVGGGAVALIAWSEFRHAPVDFPLEEFIPVLFAAVIGSVSFWGSNIAFAKLQDLIPTKPIAVPGQQVLNALLLVGLVAACVVLASSDDPSEGIFIAVLIGAAILGNLVVLPIGGADMPVVISLLNAATGLSAAAAGFSLDNVALIVAGTLVGSSGTILTLEMATAMNRSIPNILFAGFGGAPAATGAPGEERPHTSIGAQDAAIKLAYADSVVIVPGYGLAVAQAQHAVKEMANELEKRGVEVNYAIHPVAGRMPGHMNVLLAEADVPYEKLREMEDINPEMPRTDVAVIIGANDVTNPAAKNDPDSPIAGMPIIEANEAKQVIVIKRSMSPGLRGHRQRPLLPAEHGHALRRREGRGGRDRRGDRRPLSDVSHLSRSGPPRRTRGAAQPTSAPSAPDDQQGEDQRDVRLDEEELDLDLLEVLEDQDRHQDAGGAERVDLPAASFPARDDRVSVVIRHSPRTVSAHGVLVPCALSGLFFACGSEGVASEDRQARSGWGWCALSRSRSSQSHRSALQFRAPRLRRRSPTGSSARLASKTTVAVAPRVFSWPTGQSSQTWSPTTLPNSTTRRACTPCPSTSAPAGRTRAPTARIRARFESR